MPGTISTQADGTLLAAFSALLGPTVIQAYVALTSTGGLSVALGYSFQAWTQLHRPFPVFPGRLPQVPVEAPGAGRKPAAGTPQPLAIGQTASLSATGMPPEPGPIVFPPHPQPPPLPPHPPPPPPPPPPPLWFTITYRNSFLRRLAGPYLCKAALSAGLHNHGTSCSDANNQQRSPDLTGFSTTQSEYVPLKSLGNIPLRYPSLTGVYLGEVSNTVVAIPASYGVVHGVSGCEMGISAVVDLDADSGSRFQVSLTLGPMIDPCDFMQLGQDVLLLPDANDRILTADGTNRSDATGNDIFKQ